MTLPLVVCDEKLTITNELARLPLELRLMPGRSINRSSLEGASALLTRTITQIDASLLTDTNVQFVGSASAGTDHVDTDFLARQGIDFTNAAGSNASAVCDYVIAAMVETGRIARVLAGASVGIVGHGHVGRQLAERLSGMGATIRIYDPLVADIPETLGVDAIKDVLDCDIVSLHAALHDSQAFSSRSMIGPAEASLCRPGALFINAGRGELLADGALSTLFANGVDVVLDTWPGEPNISLDTLGRVGVATPHIAGYSKRSKAKATNLLLPPMCTALGINSAEGEQIFSEPHHVIEAREQDSVSELISHAIDHIGGLSAEDSRMRRCLSDGVSEDAFDKLRHDYPLRDELLDVCVVGVDGDDALTLQSAGCQIG
ncbi:MAG: 4-phosphoerythronate dehydrogenase [Luminiphilus sp.]|nr:4-phosphoerythronate dehydrogenase [Luminiphilus sp.]